MEIFLGWIIFSFVVAFIGGNRRIGFFASLLLSLFLSPLIGLIVTLVSPTLESIEFQKRTLEALEGRSSARRIDEELNRLIHLLNEGKITEAEYVSLRKKLIDRPSEYKQPELSSIPQNTEVSTLESVFMSWKFWSAFLTIALIWAGVLYYNDKNTVHPIDDNPYVIDIMAVDMPPDTGIYPLKP